MNAQTPDREALGRALLEEHAAGYTAAELGKKYHMTSNAVKGLIRTARLKQTPAEFNVIQLGTPLELTGDFIIVGDVHVPATDWQFAQLVSRVAQRTGINRLIIAGDFFNFDLWSIYPSIVPGPTWHMERDAARVLIGDWLETFSEIYTIQGNHDQRLSKWSAAEFDEQDVYGMVATSKKLTHSPRGFCTVTSGGQTWRVTHPTNYSRNKLVVADVYAQKYQSNIISFHEHFIGKGTDRYNHYVIVNGGCLVDEKKLAYTSMMDSNMPAMCKGFVVLKGGVAEVLGAHPFTSWHDII